MSLDIANSRFDSFFELIPKGLVEPPSALSEWQRCSKCPDFWFQHSAELQRHSHIFHDSVDLTSLSTRPFTCTYRLPRQLDSEGIPCGQFKFCGQTFPTAAELKVHKEQSEHIQRRAATNIEEPGPPPIILLFFIYFFFYSFIKYLN